jgi:hypothetical protein
MSNKQSRAVDKERSYSLGVGRDIDNISLQKPIVLRNSQRLNLRTGLILWLNENGTRDLVRGMLGACLA